MEVPIQIAVRVRPEYNARDIICLQTNPYTNQINCGNQQTFPVTYALPNDCSQNQLFNTVAYPLLHSLLDGCDISVVTVGQKGTGKTYTLFGPGLHCALSESEYGIVPRAVREIFNRLALHPERNFSITVAWTQICGENIQDLLGTGSVQCCSVSDAFQWLQLGMSNRAPHHAHTLFTITLEQQWIGPDGLLQHRISTASFADLTSSDKVYIIGPLGEPQAIPTDSGLLALDRCVSSLTDLCHGYQTFVPYNQSTLTTLLKDSFGGRAKTLVIACVSPLLQDYNETLYTLQFISRVQNIRNYVTTNSFSNITTTDDYTAENYTNEQDSVERSTNADMFGLQFAASQWLKLVSNAENLFNKLIANNVLSDKDRDQIAEWLFLKQECEECLSSEETISIGVTEPRRSLGRIEEETETDQETTTTSGPDTESETETDVDFQQQSDLIEKIDALIEKFKIQTDQLIFENHDAYFKSDNLKFQANNTKTPESEKSEEPEVACSPSLHQQGARGRRKSIHPGSELISETELGKSPLHFNIEPKDETEARSSPELDEKLAKDTDELLKTNDPVKKIKALSLSTEAKQNRIRQVVADLEGVQKQIEELEYTIQIKEQLIQDMIKNSETRTFAKQKFQKKRSKLEEEYYKARTELAQAESLLLQSNPNEKSEYRTKVEKYRNLALFYEKRLKDIESVKQIPEESARKVLELENSLHTSKKQMERLQKQLRKEEKRKACLEQELIEDKQKLAELEQQTSKAKADEERRNLREVSARISHLDQVLKEKSIDLERAADVDEKESLRHEIRNLRRTRDCLVEQRCQLDRKLQKEKMLTDVEERKLLECEEAIEAIDAAIEYKNELICGRKEMDITRIEREKGEEMLMQRLMKLSENEMRTLLYKYFQKVIDLRDSSKKLEMQVIQLERECETSAWRIQALSHALQQVRLEGERRIVLLQRQHEDKLNLMLRHFAEETSTGSSTERKNDKIIVRANDRNKQHTDNLPDFSSTYNLNTNSNNGANHEQILTRYKHQSGNREERERVIAKYREEGREKNRFIARFQELTRYHTEKRRVQPETTIPSQNLKQLQPSMVQPPTKVTRQKNKLIIQQSKPKKYSKT